MELIFENDYDQLFDKYESIFIDLAEYTVNLLQRNDNFSIEVNFVDNETYFYFGKTKKCGTFSQVPQKCYIIYSHR